MAKHKGTTSQVRHLLSNFQSYRDSDKALILAVGRKYGLHLTKQQRKAFMEMPPAESITRARRALRDEFPESENVREGRYKKFQAMREKYGSRKAGVAEAKKSLSNYELKYEPTPIKELLRMPKKTLSDRFITKVKGIADAAKQRKRQERLGNTPQAAITRRNKRTGTTGREKSASTTPRSGKVQKSATRKSSKVKA
ncbi:hypothetical protein [Caudoviricetes sp.]|nr:hypothetical protein [Caudoviricetes sp.]